MVYTEHMDADQIRAAQEMTGKAMGQARPRREIEHEVGPLEEIAPGVLCAPMTCTVQVSNLGRATVAEFVEGHSRKCGKPAWYTEKSSMSDEILGECYEHAHQSGSLYLTPANL